jgi:hypothetical protein
VEDLLGILAVHPMREAAARAYLTDAGADPAALEELLHDGRVSRAQYRGETFFVRSDAAGVRPASD